MRIELTGSLFDSKRTPIEQVLKTYHERLKRLWRESVQAFIFSAVEAMSIDTGMSVASFRPLAAEVRLRTILLETLRGRGPKRGPRKGYTDIQGVYHANQFKSQAHGERLGRQAYKLEFGTPSNPDLTFVFDIVVFQHEFHEPTWNSLQKGKKSFIDYFNTNFDRIVNVKDLVVQVVGF